VLEVDHEVDAVRLEGCHHGLSSGRVEYEAALRGLVRASLEDAKLSRSRIRVNGHGELDDLAHAASCTSFTGTTSTGLAISTTGIPCAFAIATTSTSR
jgi:Arc/MetJ family transcription regulator